MNKLIEITKSWIIATNPTKEQKEIAEYRSLICDKCPHLNYIRSIDMHTCGLCGCPLKGKIYSPVGPEACPDKRWKK